MTTSARRLVLPLVSFIFGVIGLGLAAYFVFSPDRPSATTGVGGPFQLVDQNGAAVTEKALLGKPSLIFFGFTHCPDVCPTALYELTQLYTALGPDADRLNSFFITVDPERDSPAQLKTYLSSFDPHIVALTGSTAAVEPVLKAFRVYAKKVPTANGEYTMDHTALVYLMDKTGRFVGAFNLARPPADSAKDLQKLF